MCLNTNFCSQGFLTKLLGGSVELKIYSRGGPLLVIILTTKGLRHPKVKVILAVH